MTKNLERAKHDAVKELQNLAQEKEHELCSRGQDKMMLSNTLLLEQQELATEGRTQPRSIRRLLLFSFCSDLKKYFNFQVFQAMYHGKALR